MQMSPKEQFLIDLKEHHSQFIPSVRKYLVGPEEMRYHRNYFSPTIK